MTLQAEAFLNQVQQTNELIALKAQRPADPAEALRVAIEQEREGFHVEALTNYKVANNEKTDLSVRKQALWAIARFAKRGLVGDQDSSAEANAYLTLYGLDPSDSAVIRAMRSVAKKVNPKLAAELWIALKDWPRLLKLLKKNSNSIALVLKKFKQHDAPQCESFVFDNLKPLLKATSKNFDLLFDIINDRLNANSIETICLALFPRYSERKFNAAKDDLLNDHTKPTGTLLTRIINGAMGHYKNKKTSSDDLITDILLLLRVNQKGLIKNPIENKKVLPAITALLKQAVAKQNVELLTKLKGRLALANGIGELGANSLICAAATFVIGGVVLLVGAGSLSVWLGFLGCFSGGALLMVPAFIYHERVNKLGATSSLKPSAKIPQALNELKTAISNMGNVTFRITVPSAPSLASKVVKQQVDNVPTAPSNDSFSAKTAQ